MGIKVRGARESARESARRMARPAVSVRDLEAQVWRWRLAIGAAFALTLVMAPTRAEWLPLGLVAGAYLLAYALLRSSGLRCPWFCMAIFGIDIGAITAAVLFSGGAQSTLVFMYLFPVALMAITRGTWAAAMLGSVTLALYVSTVGAGVLVGSAPKDTAVLVIALYGVALLVGRAHAQVTRTEIDLARRLVKLHTGVARLSGEDSIAALLAESVTMGTELTGARYGAVSIWDERGEIAYFATAGLDPAEVAHLGRPPSASGLLGQVRDAPGPVRLGDARAHPAASALPSGHPEVRSFLGAPIHALGNWKGAYYLLDKDGAEAFTLADEQIAEMLAAHVASAVVMRRLVASQREMHDSLLGMLVQISDAREHALAGHSERVSSYARALGELAGLAGEELHLVTTAGLLHDIGKIGVPDSILGKPGRLDDEERLVMMAHSGLGAAIVERAGPLARLAPFVRHHHERWDGTGYPDALQGDAIPLGARIIALADMLDAVTGDRPYRAARSMEEAMEEVARCAGSHFDPALAALVPRVIEQVPERPEAHAPATSERFATLAELHSSVQVAGWKLFTRIAKELDVLLDLPVLAERLLDLLCSELEVSGASLSMLDPGGDLLQIVAWEGRPVLLPVGSVLPRGIGIPWEAVETATTLVVADVTKHPLYGGMQDAAPGAAVYLPLLAGTETLGVLALYRPLPQTFGARDVAYLEAIAAPVAELLAISRLHAELERAVRTDTLTQAVSRRYGLERLAEACAHARRSGQPCAVVMLDLDGFKELNDRFGHQVGDEVLCEVVRQLRKELRGEDVLARYGGDEFFVVAPDTSATATADLLRRLVATSPARHVTIAGREVPLPSWSAGAATWPEDGQDPEELIRAADSRLYRRKREHQLATS